MAFLMLDGARSCLGQRRGSCSTTTKTRWFVPLRRADAARTTTSSRKYRGSSFVRSEGSRTKKGRKRLFLLLQQLAVSRHRDAPGGGAALKWTRCGSIKRKEKIKHKVTSLFGTPASLLAGFPMREGSAAMFRPVVKQFEIVPAMNTHLSPREQMMSSSRPAIMKRRFGAAFASFFRPERRFLPILHSGSGNAIRRSPRLAFFSF